MITLSTIQVSAPFEGYLLPVSGFPMLQTEVLPLLDFLRDLGRIANVGKSLEVFIQAAQLVPKEMGGTSAAILSQHGRDWIPKLGLGIWPDRPAPSLWTPKDFEDLAPGEKPRRLMYQVLRITKSIEARENARDTLLGLGTVLQIICSAPDAFLEKMRSTFLKSITEPSFSCFSFYVPLFEANTLSRASASDLESWMGGASVYVRESAEDKAILLLAAESLVPILRKLGAQFQAEPHPTWVIS